MNSDINIEDALYEALKTSSLVSSVSGELRKGDRDDNSTNEDVIILVTANQNGEIQEAGVNVNVYVPDTLINGALKRNGPRLRTLCSLASEALEVINTDGYRFTLDVQRVVECPDSHEHCIWNKLNYQFYNRQ